MTRGSKPSTKADSPKEPKPQKVNVLADQGSEEDAPNAAFAAALEYARQQTTSATPSQKQTPDNQIAGKPEKQKPDRAGEGYTKVTYRVRNEAADAIEDMKLLLKRKYGFKKVLYEEIVEEALLGIKQDLDEHQEQSILVQRLRDQKQPESQ